MSKKSIECYDNVDHKNYLEMIFAFTGDLMADEVRWLKKFKYVPIEKCVCCGNEVIGQYHCLCFNCKESGIDESKEVNNYINKNPN